MSRSSYTPPSFHYEVKKEIFSYSRVKRTDTYIRRKFQNIFTIKHLKSYSLKRSALKMIYKKFNHFMSGSNE